MTERRNRWRRVLPWVCVPGIAVLLCGAWVWRSADGRLSRRFEPDRALFAMDTAGGGDLERGRRLAVVYGCASCHGDAMTGRVIFDLPGIGRVVAPNLTRLGEAWEGTDWNRAIRTGVRPDGTGMLSIMPAFAYHGLADDDMADLVAYLGGLEAGGEVLPGTRAGWLMRWLIVTGRWPGGLLAPEASGVLEAWERSPDRSDPAALGAYLARTACAECHGADLLGMDLGRHGLAPALAVGAAYDPDEFARLLREGRARDGRELAPLMSGVGRRYGRLEEREIRALHRFVSGLVQGADDLEFE